MENKERLYGQLVVDFANAETSDEACLKLLENMQEAFDLPPDFADKATAIFLSNSTKPDIDHQEIWAKYNETIECIERQFHRSCYSPKEWCHLDQTVALESIIDYGSMDDEQEIRVEFKTDYVPIRDLPTITGMVKQETTNQLIELIKLIYRIEGSTYIAKLNMDLQKLLTKIVNKDRLADDELLKTLLDVCNDMAKRYVITEDGIIVEKSSIDENKYLQNTLWQHSKWTQLIEEPLAYCLVKFLLLDENRSYLHKCEECRTFYVAETLRSQRFCGNTCRLAYHNRIRIETGKAAADKRKKREEGTD